MTGPQLAAGIDREFDPYAITCALQVARPTRASGSLAMSMAYTLDRANVIMVVIMLHATRRRPSFGHLTASPSRPRQRALQAFVKGEEIGGRTVADCEGLLAIRREQLAHSTEIEDAIRDEGTDIENVLGEHRRRCAQAAGALVSRAAFLSLVTRIQQGFATLGDTRLTVSGIRKQNRVA